MGEWNFGARLAIPTPSKLAPHEHEIFIKEGGYTELNKLNISLTLLRDGCDTAVWCPEIICPNDENFSAPDEVASADPSRIGSEAEDIIIEDL